MVGQMCEKFVSNLARSLSCPQSYARFKMADKAIKTSKTNTIQYNFWEVCNRFRYVGTSRYPLEIGLQDHSNIAALIYADISLWRSRLKAINAEINEAQTESYNDIADGARIKGWLLIGKGLRHIPGIQLIEGRAKEDIRWDELQNEGGFMRGLAFWTIVVTVAVLLGIGRKFFAHRYRMKS